MRILIASDKFKGSLGSKEAGERIAAGIRSVWPRVQIEVVPIADGGEGTADAIWRARGGAWIACPAHDALGRVIQARYLWFDESRLALMDMSEAAGRQRLAPNERDPMHASTFGVGEMLLHASGRGATEVIIALGGSTTNDGGFGMARALGFCFLGVAEQTLGESVGGLLNLTRITQPNELALPRVTAAGDVRNPLLGERGATRVFGAQKGATPEQLEILERALTRLAEVTANQFQRDQRATPGAGAAGGLGFGLLTFCGAVMRSGFEVVAEAIDLRSRIVRADVVITGEGKLDRQTLEGKAPVGVARMARELKKPVFAIVGQATDETTAREIFDRVLTLDDPTPDYRDSAELLEKRARQLASSLAAR